MINRWRIKHLTLQATRDFPQRAVTEYSNPYYKGVVAKISLVRNQQAAAASNPVTSVQLQPAITKKKAVAELFKESGFAFRIHPNGILEVKIETEAQFGRYIQFLKDRMKSEISDALLREIESHYSAPVRDSQALQAADEKAIEPKGAAGLREIFQHEPDFESSGLSSFPIDKLRKFLAELGDPNQMHGYALVEAVTWLEFYHDKDQQALTRLLLTYGADHFQRVNHYLGYVSPMELIIKYKQVQVEKLINDIIKEAQETADRRTKKSLMVVNDIDIVTTPQGRIKTTIKGAVEKGSKKERVPVEFEITFGPTAGLTRVELDELFEFYKQFFEPSAVMQGSLNDFYLYEMQGLLKFVEVIRGADGKINGMTLYEIVQDKQYPDHIFVHLSGILVNKDFSGIGLTDPLVMSLAHAMPKLFKDRKIVCVYQSISEGSARLASCLSHSFPKNRTKFLSDVADKIIHHLQRDLDPRQGKLLTNEPAECWSQIEVQVRAEQSRGPKESKEVGSLEASQAQQFYESMRGVTNIGKDTHRGVLYMFYISDETWKKYAADCGKMRIDAGSYINTLAQHLEKCMVVGDFRPKFNGALVCLPVNADLFRYGRVVPSDQVIPQAAVIVSRLSTEPARLSVVGRLFSREEKAHEPQASPVLVLAPLPPKQGGT